MSALSQLWMVINIVSVGTSFKITWMFTHAELKLYIDVQIAAHW